MTAGKDRHHGEAEAVQAEESEVMNAAGGAPPPFLTSRKAKRKTALRQQDGQSRKELAKNLMDNLSTLKTVKSSILEGLAVLKPIVESLESSGVRIIQVTSDNNREHSILFSGNYDNFRRWVDENELDVILEHDGKEGHYLQWRLSCQINGVEIKSYLSDREKREYDGENLGD